MSGAQTDQLRGTQQFETGVAGVVCLGLEIGILKSVMKISIKMCILDFRASTGLIQIGVPSGTLS